MVTLTDAERLDITYAVVEGKPVVPLVEAIVADRVEAERDRLLDRFEALAERLSGYDCLEAPDDVPLSVDVPDDYETGIHSAARDLRALIAEERAR